MKIIDAMRRKHTINVLNNNVIEALQPHTVTNEAYEYTLTCAMANPMHTNTLLTI